MTRAYLTQTNFTSGELAPELLGRVDLRAYENGAAKLRNVVVRPTGGVTRRPGTAYVANVDGPGRLVALEIGPDPAHLLVFTHLKVDVFLGDGWLASATTPWTEAQLAQIAWAQHRDGLLVCHPDVPPRRIVRESETVWTVLPWTFVEEATGRRQPYEKFAPAHVALQASGTTGTVTITTSEPVFVAEHLGTIIRRARKEILLTNIQSPTQAVGDVRQDLEDASTTTDWDEQAFSPARGWPATVTFHQGRMVIGGSRDLPQRIWMSKTDAPFNFDLGTGLDDEALAFSLAADRNQAIRAMMSGRHLQVFTSAGEWVIAGDPVRPQNIREQQQTRVGSIRSRRVPPRNVDGATLFAARSGRELREFIFADTVQAYQAADLALLSRHLIVDPVDQDFDQGRRLFFVVMAEGSLGTAALNRNAEVTAWSRQETAGRFLSVAVADGETMLLVERTNGVFLERLDDSMFVDAGVALSQPTPAVTWNGLDHLEGETIGLIADGVPVGDAVVAAGTVELPTPARELVAGLPYTHVIEPLPVVAAGNRAGGLDTAYRPVRVTFRLLDTRALRVDTGSGLYHLPFASLAEGVLDAAPPSFTGDRALRAFGWRRGAAQPPWRIEQDTPVPCTLLAATTEIKVTT